MKSLYQGQTVEGLEAAPDATEQDAAGQTDPTTDTIHPLQARDAHRDVQLAVQRALASNWEEGIPRIAVLEHNGIDTVYVSTLGQTSPQARADIRGAVRAALAPYARLAPFTNVVFLTRRVL